MTEINITALEEVKLTEEELKNLEEFQMNLANGGAGGVGICWCET